MQLIPQLVRVKILRDDMLRPPNGLICPVGHCKQLGGTSSSSSDCSMVAIIVGKLAPNDMLKLVGFMLD